MPVAEYATRMRATGHPTGYCWRWLDNAECPGSCRFKHQHPPGWSAAQRRAHGEKQYQVYRDQERAEADALDAYMGTAHWCSSCEQSTDECDCVECGDCGKRVDESVMCAVADCCCMECCGCAQCSRCRGHIAEEEVAFLGESELDEGEEEEEEKEPMCPACFEKAVGEQRRRREQQQQQQQEQQQQHQERQRWPEQEAHLESEACGGDTEECGCERCEACTGLFDQDGGSAARCPQEEGSCTDCCDCQRCSGCGRHAAAREGLARAGSAAGGRESLCPTCIMMGALMNAVAGPGGSDGGGRGGGRGGGSEGGSRGGSGGGSGGSGAPGASRGPRPLHGPNIVGFTWAQLGCLKAQILVFRRLKMSNRLTAADLGAGVQPPPLSAVV
ncbi:hypothetical protein FOA52_000946 [Chlamydomonas sp. UWO 241]|nr:hypothetical protein FOA52_000946 [Chlamydomonas sp. UWO 241]